MEADQQEEFQNYDDQEQQDYEENFQHPYNGQYDVEIADHQQQEDYTNQNDNLQDDQQQYNEFQQQMLQEEEVVEGDQLFGLNIFGSKPKEEEKKAPTPVAAPQVNQQPKQKEPEKQSFFGGAIDGLSNLFGGSKKKEEPVMQPPPVQNKDLTPVVTQAPNTTVITTNPNPSATKPTNEIPQSNNQQMIGTTPPQANPIAQPSGNSKATPVNPQSNPSQNEKKPQPNAPQNEKQQQPAPTQQQQPGAPKTASNLNLQGIEQPPSQAPSQQVPQTVLPPQVAQQQQVNPQTVLPQSTGLPQNVAAPQKIVQIQPPVIPQQIPPQQTTLQKPVIPQQLPQQVVQPQPVGIPSKIPPQQIGQKQQQQPAPIIQQILPQQMAQQQPVIQQQVLPPQQIAQPQTLSPQLQQPIIPTQIAQNVNPTTALNLNPLKQLFSDIAQPVLPQNIIASPNLNSNKDVIDIQSSIGIKEALAKNFAKKLMSANTNNKVQEEVKSSVTQVRNEFLIFLAKIYENDTKQDGVMGCNRIIQRNSDNPAVLRVILGALCDRSTVAANMEKKTQGLMFHAQMFGFLAQCYKTELKDPLDKPPSLIKTIQRIQEAIYTFFKTSSQLVWRGCGISLQEIFENCFPEPLEPVLQYSTAANLIFDPLLSQLTSGSNPVSIQGASYCLKHLLEYFTEQKANDTVSPDHQLTMSIILDQLHQPFIQHTIKYLVDNESQIKGIQLLVETLGIRVIVSENCNHLDGIIKLCMRATGPTSKIPQKKSACDLIAALGENLKLAAELVVPTYFPDVMKCLDQLSTEKQVEMQKSRTRANEVWQNLQTLYNELTKQQAGINDVAEVAKVGGINLVGLMGNNLANRFSKLRDQAKELKDVQRRAVSAGKDASGTKEQAQNSAATLEAQFLATTKKAIAQNFLKKGKATGATTTTVANQNSSPQPSASKQKMIEEDLNKIKELNQIMRTGQLPASGELGGGIQTPLLQATGLPQNVQPPQSQGRPLSAHLAQMPQHLINQARSLYQRQTPQQQLTQQQPSLAAQPQLPIQSAASLYQKPLQQQPQPQQSNLQPLLPQELSFRQQPQAQPQVVQPMHPLHQLQIMQQQQMLLSPDSQQMLLQAERERLKQQALRMVQNNPQQLEKYSQQMGYMQQQFLQPAERREAYRDPSDIDELEYAIQQQQTNNQGVRQQPGVLEDSLEPGRQQQMMRLNQNQQVLNSALKRQVVNQIQEEDPFIDEQCDDDINDRQQLSLLQSQHKLNQSPISPYTQQQQQHNVFQSPPAIAQSQQQLQYQQQVTAPTKLLQNDPVSGGALLGSKPQILPQNRAGWLSDGNQQYQFDQEELLYGQQHLNNHQNDIYTRNQQQIYQRQSIKDLAQAAKQQVQPPLPQQQQQQVNNLKSQQQQLDKGDQQLVQIQQQQQTQQLQQQQQQSILTGQQQNMKAVIDKEKLLSIQQQQQAALPSPQTSTNGTGPDPALAQLISQQILNMQKQMERGFGLMCDKINLIEGRVEGASQQLEMLEKHIDYTIQASERDSDESATADASSSFIKWI